MKPALNDEVFLRMVKEGSVTRERALEIASDVYKDNPQLIQQFNDWFESNGDALLYRVNANG